MTIDTITKANTLKNSIDKINEKISCIDNLLKTQYLEVIINNEYSVCDQAEIKVFILDILAKHQKRLIELTNEFNSL